MPYVDSKNVAIGNGYSLRIEGCGISTIKPYTYTNCVINLHSDLHTPSVSHNLISIHKLYIDNNVIVEFHAIEFFVKEAQSKIVVAQGRLINGLYILKERYKSLQHFFRLLIE